MQKRERQEVVNAYKVEIYIAGKLEEAYACAQRFCDEVGLCVTVTPTNYIFRGGSETGVVVGLINYGRFPKSNEEIWEIAVDLATALQHDLGQGSWTVQDHQYSLWFTQREGDLK